MIRRPPRSTPLSLHDALPISQYELQRLECARLLGVDEGARHVSRGDAARDHLMVHVLEAGKVRSEEHTSELQSRQYLVCRLLLEKHKWLEHRPYVEVVELTDV